MEVIGLIRLQNEILEQYEDDFGKHASGTNLARVRMVWNSIPIQLAKENKKFFFCQMKQGARMKDFEVAIEWLLDCGLITKVHKVNSPSVPLKAYVDYSAFKLFSLDIGLQMHLLLDPHYFLHLHPYQRHSTMSLYATR